MFCLMRFPIPVSSFDILTGFHFGKVGVEYGND